MADPTYKLIGAYTVPSAAYTYTISSIPQTYTDFVVLFCARGDYSANAEVEGQIGSLTSGYTNILCYGTTTAYNATDTLATWSGQFNGSGSTANMHSNCQQYFPNYTATVQPQSYQTRSVAELDSASNISPFISGGFNNSTAAVTSITYYAWQSFMNFTTTTTFYLYGIKNS